MMRIGTRIDPDWLDRPEDLSFLKQIGVDCVDITLDICPGFTESGGRANREGLEQVAEAIDRAGLKIERANALNLFMKAIYLDQPGAERELDHLVHNVELCGEFKFPVVGVQCFQASQFTEFPESFYHWVEGRGGYRHLKVDLSDALEGPPPPGAPTYEELWERTLRVYRTIVPAAERAGVKIAMHGNDPPVPSLYGVPQILYNFDALDRLLSEVPSPYSGLTFCVGTRYESGEDIYEGIRRFGGQGKIFHVHFRNVRGTIPANRSYEEVIPDAGDVDMARVAAALRDVGYDGVLDYDHIMKLGTDGPEGREYIAYCVGHTRGILQALESGS